MNWRIVLVLAGVLATLAAAPAIADQTLLKNADDIVSGHPGLTYGDLVRQAIPNLGLNADGHRSKATSGHRRATWPAKSSGEPSEPAVLGSIEDKRILVGGKKRIALLADLGGKESRIEGLALLMLFDDEGTTPKLLDAADVGIDKDTVLPTWRCCRWGLAIRRWSAGQQQRGPDDGRLHDRFAGRRPPRHGGPAAAHLREAVQLEGDRGGALRHCPRSGRGPSTDRGDRDGQDHHTGHEGCNDERHPAAAIHVFHAVWRWNPASRRFEPAASFSATSKR